MEKLKKAIQDKVRWDGLIPYINLVEKNQISNPNDSLDGAKSILESISKTILVDKGIEFKADESIGNLVKQAFSSLPIFTKLSTIDVGNTKAILNSFATISNSIGAFRNRHGFFAHGRDLQSQKFDRYLLDLTISSSDLLASFLVISHADDLRDRSRIYYDECENFNIWLDGTNGNTDVLGIKISASKALFDQDEIAYKDKYFDYINSPHDLIDSLDYIDSPDSCVEVIGEIKSLNYNFNTEELEKLNNIAKAALEQIQPSLDIMKDIQLPKIDTSVLEKASNTLRLIQPNLDVVRKLSAITLNDELVKKIQNIQEISKKLNLHI